MLPVPSIRPIFAEQTYTLRHSVLWPDKAMDYVKVENDAEGYHFGAFNHRGIIAVISLFLQINEGIITARFRKFAVSSDFQHQGVGTRLLNHIMAEAIRLGAISLWCDARLDTADFYRRFGMEAVSEVFYKGTIPYAKFSRSLQ